MGEPGSCNVGDRLLTSSPLEYEVFGPNWGAAGEIRDTIGSLQGVYEWVRDIRAESNAYIASLTDDDWHRVPPSSEFDMTVAHWLFITAAHTALHIGRIQLLRDGRMPCPICGTMVGGTGGTACPSCGPVAPPLPANTFSFNSPSSMCLQCEGRGLDYELHLDRLVPGEQMTLRGVLERVEAASSFGHMLRGRLKPYADRPFAGMPDNARTLILYGVETRGTSRHRSHSLFRVLKRRLQRGEDLEGVMIDPNSHLASMH